MTGAWPLHTEMGSRLRARESAALASSIYIVARKIKRSGTGFYIEVHEEVYERLRSGGEILERIAPLVLKEKYLSGKDHVYTEQLYQASLKTPGEKRKAESPSEVQGSKG